MTEDDNLRQVIYRPLRTTLTPEEEAYVSKPIPVPPSTLDKLEAAILKANPTHEKTARKIAPITISRVKSFEELNAPTEKEGNEVFLKKTRELWTDLTTHGVFRKDKDGNTVLQNFPDFDGKCSIYLLRQAGIDTSKIKFVAPEESIPGSIHVDTGGGNGITSSLDETTAGFDEHPGHVGSATKLVYEGLKSVGLLKSNWGLDKLVEFANQIDNNEYPDAAKKYKESYKTIYGLHEFVPVEKLVNYFNRGWDPDKALTDEEMAKFSRKTPGTEPDLVKRSRRMKEVIELSKVKFEEMESDGFVIKTREYGSVVIDIDKKVPGGWQAAQGFGYDTYIIWSPAEQSFVISSNRVIDISLPQGMKIGEHMFIKPRSDKRPLDEDLTTVLYQMTQGEYAKEGKLKEYLDAEAAPDL